MKTILYYENVCPWSCYKPSKQDVCVSLFTNQVDFVHGQYAIHKE